MENLVWAIIPIAAVSAPFLYMAFSKWIEYKKSQEGTVVIPDWETRMAESEDALAAAQRRIRNLETIVANRLLDAPEGSGQQIKVSEDAASRIERKARL